MNLRKIATLLATLIASRNSKDSSLVLATQGEPVHDDERSYSTFNKIEKTYTRDTTDDPLVGRILKINLEFLKDLQTKYNICESLLPPEIIEITDKQIVSKLIKFDREKETLRLHKLLNSNEQIRQDLALASILGIEDLVPSPLDDLPEKNGEVNIITGDKKTGNNKLRIIDMDNLGMEIDLADISCYRSDAFKAAVKILEEKPILKHAALERLTKIFPKTNKDELQQLLDNKIELIKKATVDPIASFFNAKDPNWRLITMA